MNSSDSEELSGGVTLSDENDSDWNPSDEMESDFSESQESSSFSSNGSCASLGYDSPHDDVRVLSSSSSYSTSSGSESSYSSSSESSYSSSESSYSSEYDSFEYTVLLPFLSYT